MRPSNMNTWKQFIEERGVSSEERAVLQQMVDGKDAAEIGENLNLSTTAILSHQMQLAYKFNTSDLVKLVRLALEYELVN